MPDQGSLSIKGPVRIGPDVGVSTKILRDDIYDWQPKKDILGMRTKWEFLDYPERDPIDLCDNYLSSLNKVLDSFVRRFTISKS